MEKRKVGRPKGTAGIYRTPKADKKVAVTFRFAGGVKDELDKMADESRMTKTNLIETAISELGISPKWLRCPNCQSRIHFTNKEAIATANVQCKKCLEKNLLKKQKVFENIC